MYNSVKIHKLSPTQERKLKNGKKVVIKLGGDRDINLSDEQLKKLNKASSKGRGLTVQLDPYQRDNEEEQDGGRINIRGAIKKAQIGKKIIKFAKDTKLVKRVGDALIDRAIKTIAGSGLEEETPRKKRGRPKKDGGALRPAGY